MQGGAGDEWIGRLAQLFATHPAWVDAAGRVSADAVSNVYFSHRPDEVWRLERRGGRTLLLPGASEDPDFVFRFTPAAIARLEAVGGGIGEFAVELFGLMLAEEPELRVGFRVVAGLPRLVRRGYLGLLRDAGPRVVAFGAAHGVRTLAELRRFLRGLRERGTEHWERVAKPPDDR